MRPVSIIWFERLFLLSLALVAINGIARFDDLVAQAGADPNIAAQGWGTGMVGAILAISVLVPLLLWYLIARRGSVIAKWILVVITAAGLLFIGFDAERIFSLANIVTAVVTVLQVVAVALLFRQDARAWLSGEQAADHSF